MTSGRRDLDFAKSRFPGISCRQAGFRYVSGRLRAEGGVRGRKSLKKRSEIAQNMVLECFHEVLRVFRGGHFLVPRTAQGSACSASGT
jgi:hypothetical protein